MSDRSPSRAPVAARRTTRQAHPPVDALVAIVPRRGDLERARLQRWYRIPADKAPAPLLAGQISTIAFYLPKGFGGDAYHVRWQAPLLGFTTHPRLELLPDEPHHPRATDPYLRLELGSLEPLAQPIPSRRLRRIVFIATTRAKLATAAEINDLFHSSPLEDRLWNVLKAEGYEPEREYYVPGDRNARYALDFAIFGHQRNVDVECDGDTYHLNRDSARYDNLRNNFLTTRGWCVLRFTTAQLIHELPEVMAQVRSTVKSCGGEVATAPTPAPILDPLWQPALWDPSIAQGRPVNPRERAPRASRRRK